VADKTAGEVVDRTAGEVVDKMTGEASNAGDCICMLNCGSKDVEQRTW
jgi:hypothetical protein